MVSAPKTASDFTSAVNRAAAAGYPLGDRADFVDADRGFLTKFATESLAREDGVAFWDSSVLDYISDDAAAPDTVNSSLWRQSQLIKREGLFEVVEGLYQIRGDANLTIVDAPDGLVIIDTTTDVDTAAACMDLFRTHTGNTKPVAAVILTHTHVDHYGGTKGVVSEEDVASGKVPIIAPGTVESFTKFAIGENVLAGNAMSRRMTYTFGLVLPHCDQGLVTIGLSPGTSRYGHWNISYIAPTDPITTTGETRNLGGWDFEFLYAPDTEAPEEMHIWIPAIKALTCAENANHSMHNIQTLRGARTRDARNFARYLDQSLVMWGERAEVHYGPHSWPVWGNENVVPFLESQRDMYKFIHDQAMRLANQGLTSLEAAEQIELPEAIGNKWYNRYYHGGLHHNVRAVFYKELGYWDGDPASILPLTPGDNARKHVDLIGRDKILAEGRKAFDSGDYRWAVQVLHHAVFADPEDTEAKELQADAYEQLGYQQENTQYRAICLAAAKELREGVVTEGTPATASLDSILAMPIDLLFDYIAIHVIGSRAGTADVAINLTFTDGGGDWHMWVRNGVLNARIGHTDTATLTLSGPKAALAALLLEPGNAKVIIGKTGVETDGDVAALEAFASVLDTFNPHFNLATP
jgi:alkyl sulfatase BDS1-like metallo-beta-lactamase superfamily hydrolase